MLHEISHGTCAAGGENRPTGFRRRGERRGLRVEAARVGGNYEIRSFKKALALFVGHELVADVNSLRQSQIVGEHLVVFEGAVAVVRNPAEDNQGGIRIFQQRANNEIEILVVADVSKGEEHLFPPLDLPLFPDFFGIVADLDSFLRSDRHLDGADELRKNVGSGKSLVRHGDPERFERQMATEFLPPFRAEVVVAMGKVQIHRVDGLVKKNHHQVRPHPERALAVHMARRQHQGRPVFINLPSETKLVANGLKRLAELAGKRVCAHRRGPLEHTGMRRVGGGPGADVGGATENKHLDSKIVQRRGLFVNMVGNDAVRSRALDEDIKGRSGIGARHGE